MGTVVVVTFESCHRRISAHLQTLMLLFVKVLTKFSVSVVPVLFSVVVVGEELCACIVDLGLQDSVNARWRDGRRLVI